MTGAGRGKAIMRGKGKKKEGLVILTAAAAALAVILIFLSAGTKMLSDYETGIAAAARKDIPKGTGITAENVSELFELREVNQSMLPGQTVTDLSQMEGKVLSGDLQENEIVTKKDMNDLAGMEASMTEPTELTFTATSIGNSVGGRICSGDVINVGITFQTDTGESRYRLAGEHIYVLEAMDDTGRPVPPEDTETACIMFRVLMERQDGERLLETLRDGDETIVTLPKS